MMRKTLSEIQLSDIESLVTDQVRELKTLDFKRDLPGPSDSDKARFLANVSSFANTSGGDLVFGVEESEGIAVSILGVACDDADKEILRLEQLIRTGVDPRVPRIDIRPIRVAPGREVIIVRVPPSLAGPHRVSFNSKFYGRNSAGRYELDVAELRTAFTTADALGERIRRFRLDRAMKIAAGETPVSVRTGPTMVLHLIPLSAFTTRRFIDISAVEKPGIAFVPMHSNGFNYRINFEGWINFDGHIDFGTGANTKPSNAYVQLHRSGIVEAVTVFEGSIPGTSYEAEILAAVPRYIQALERFGIDLPFYIFLSFVNVKGSRLAVHPRIGSTWATHTVESDTLLLPEAVVEDVQTGDVSLLVRPLFDMVWNAFGYQRSFNFDPNGQWIGGY